MDDDPLYGKCPAAFGEEPGAADPIFGIDFISGHHRFGQHQIRIGGVNPGADRQNRVPFLVDERVIQIPAGNFQTGELDGNIYGVVCLGRFLTDDLKDAQNVLGGTARIDFKIRVLFAQKTRRVDRKRLVDNQGSEFRIKIDDKFFGGGERLIEGDQRTDFEILESLAGQRDRLAKRDFSVGVIDHVVKRGDNNSGLGDARPVGIGIFEGSQIDTLADHPRNLRRIRFISVDRIRNGIPRAVEKIPGDVGIENRAGLGIDPPQINRLGIGGQFQVHLVPVNQLSGGAELRIDRKEWLRDVIPVSLAVGIGEVVPFGVCRKDIVRVDVGTKIDVKISGAFVNVVADGGSFIERDDTVFQSQSTEPVDPRAVNRGVPCNRRVEDVDHGKIIGIEGAAVQRAVAGKNRIRQPEAVGRLGIDPAADAVNVPDDVTGGVVDDIGIVDDGLPRVNIDIERAAVSKSL